jgi:hypothetical protein
VHCFEQNDAVSPGATNLLLNGGFENTTCTPGWLEDCFCPSATLYNCDVANWTCTGGDVQSYPSIFDNTLSVIPEGNNAAYFGNGNAFACSELWGDESCQSLEFCTITGIPPGYPRSNPGYGDTTGVSLAQTVSGLIVGNTYVLEFWAGGEPLQGLLLSPAIFAVDVGFGKTFLKCKPTGDSGFPTGTRYLIEFIANATSHQIKFTNWGHTCIDCTELVLDDVSLYPIEELSGTVPDCATAVQEAKESYGVVVFPNPFSSDITIVTNHPTWSSLILYDCHSRLILNQEFTNTITINTSMLSNGIYFYQIRDHNRILKSGKLVKERT